MINPKLDETSVTSPNDSHDSNFDIASAQLNDGLRSCRSVVSNYRSLLAGDVDDGLGQERFAGSDESGEGSGE